jgi:hypothetical protein
MVGPAMCFKKIMVDYIFQKRKRKDLVAYLGDEPTIGDA